MEKEPTEIRPDGTPIYGPPLPDWSKQRGQAGFAKWLIPLAALALFAAGYTFGGGLTSSAEPTWQEATIQRLGVGCLPVILVQGTAKPEQIDQLTSNLETQAAAIKGRYPDAQNIKTQAVPVPMNGPVAQKYPGVSHIGIITLERCL